MKLSAYYISTSFQTTQPCHPFLSVAVRFGVRTKSCEVWIGVHHDLSSMMLPNLDLLFVMTCSATGQNRIWIFPFDRKMLQVILMLIDFRRSHARQSFGPSQDSSTSRWTIFTSRTLAKLCLGNRQSLGVTSDVLRFLLNRKSKKSVHFNNYSPVSTT